MLPWKSFELVATKGPAQHGLEAEFARLSPDPEGALDAVRDLANMPLEEEPERVRDELDEVRADRNNETSRREGA